MPNPTRPTPAHALLAELASYPTHSAEAETLLEFVRGRVCALAVADAGDRHCAACRRQISTETVRHAFMN
jgi:hypothetical protein